MRSTFVILALLTASGCGSATQAPKGTATKSIAVTPAMPSFVNKVWRVSSGSDIPPGSLYVFLSDNTLLIASATGTPLIGRWLMSSGKMVMIEEGLTYKTDVVEAGAQRLVLRQHNPGGVVNLVMTPARTGQ